MTKAMKSKLFVCIVMLVSCAALIGAATWAWYTLSAQEDVEMNINADGMVVLAFETSITVTPEDGVLAPAVEAPDAIANNAMFANVREVGGDIAVAAQTITFAPDLSVYLDEISEADGTTVPKWLDFGISAVIETKAMGGRESQRYDIPQERLGEVFGVEWKMIISEMYTNPPEVAPTAEEILTSGTDVLAIANKTAPTVQVKDSNKIVHFALRLWLKAPQGLMPPEFVGADVTIRIAISANDRA